MAVCTDEHICSLAGILFDLHKNKNPNVYDEVVEGWREILQDRIDEGDCFDSEDHDLHFLKE